MNVDFNSDFNFKYVQQEKGSEKTESQNRKRQ